MKTPVVLVALIALALPLTAMSAPDLLSGRQDTADNAAPAVVTPKQIAVMLQRRGYRVQTVRAADSDATYKVAATRRGKSYQLIVDAHSGRVTREQADDSKNLLNN